MQFSGDWENDKDRKQWLEKLYPKMLKSCERTFKHQAGIVYKKELKFLAVHQFARPVK